MRPSPRRWDSTRTVGELDYRERLRQPALNDVRFADSSPDQHRLEPEALDPKSLALVRIAALVAVGGTVPSFGAQVDEAVSAGSSATEIVDVLVGVIPALEVHCVVAGARGSIGTRI